MPKVKFSFDDGLRATLACVAVGIVGYLAINGSEQAAGAMIGVVGAAVGYLFRGKVEATSPPRPVP